MSHAPVSSECLNCHAALAGPYCAACGQKASPPNPTFHELMHELLHETLHVDGRIWRSVWLLLSHPGRITAEYCAGHKARFLTPLRLYLIFSILAVASSTLPGSHPDSRAASERATAAQQVRERETAVRHEAAKAADSNIGQWVTDKLRDPQSWERMRHAFRDWLPRMNLFLIPVWAWLAMLVTRRARRVHTHNFPEYLYFALHANAAFSAAFAVDNLIDLLPWRGADATGDFLSSAYIIVYTLVGLRVLFGGGWIRNALRTLAIGTLYGIVYGIGFVAVMAIALLM